MVKNLVLIIPLILYGGDVLSQNLLCDISLHGAGNEISCTIQEHVGDIPLITPDMQADPLFSENTDYKEPGAEANVSSVPSASRFKQASRGYHIIVEPGIYFKVNDYGRNYARIAVINSLRLNNYIAVGLGFALRYIPKTDVMEMDSKYKHFMVPVFADVRGYKGINDKMHAYIALEAGWTFSKDHQYNSMMLEYSYVSVSGFFLNPSAGIVYSISEKIALNIGVSSEINTMDFYPVIYHQPYPSNKIFGTIGVDAGITF
jgi:hypothetical protein